MAGLSRKVHMVADFDFGPIDRYAPDLGIRVTGTNGDEPEQPKALRFQDPDGEVHIYLFSDEGRRELVRKLTGGLVVPGGGR